MFQTVIKPSEESSGNFYILCFNILYYILYYMF